MSNKREYAIGEEMQTEVGILVCSEVKQDYACPKCACVDTTVSMFCDKVLCSKYERTDKKNVIFKLKEE